MYCVLVTVLLSCNVLRAQPLSNTEEHAINERIQHLPFTHMRNMGQWDDEILYKGSYNGISVRYMQDGISFAIGREVHGEESEDETMARLRSPRRKMTAGFPDDENSAYEYLVWNLKFEGASEHVRVTGEGKQDSKTHYLKGNDPAKWVKHVPEYKLLTYHSLYDHIDLQYYGMEGNRLKYDFILSPGATIGDIRMRYEGVKQLNINELGELEIHHEWGIVKEAAPYSYQVIDGEKRTVNIRYELIGPHTFRFRLEGAYDRTRELIIDPFTLVWSTYMGATGLSTTNYSFDIAKDNSGDIYITGRCDGTYPTTAGVFQPGYGGGNSDVFVTKLMLNGSDVIYTTYLGGANTDEGYGIAVNSANEAFVTGSTQSTDFPLQGAYQGILGGGGSPDVFVTRLNAAGTGLIYSTYLGGADFDISYGIAVNSANEAYVTGWTRSTDFPLQGAYQGALGGTVDAFVTRLNSAGNGLIYSTYLGGTGNDRGHRIAVNSANEAYVTGHASSTDFPLQGAYQGILGGLDDAFITRLNAAGTGLIYSTYLGGADSDEGFGIAVNSANEAYVTGYTSSSNFPISPGAFQMNYGGGFSDMFATRLNSAGNGLIYSTYLGGADWDSGLSIAVNSANEAFVTGLTQSTDFPVSPGAFQMNHGGQSDMFATHLTAAGDSLGCGGSTYVGGSKNDYARPVVVLDESGVADTIIITGTSHSDDFPTTPGVYQFIKPNPGDYDQPVVFKMVCPSPCPPLTVNAIASPGMCCVGCTNVSTTPSGGTAPYTYVWNTTPVQTNATATGLSAGTYMVTVTDNNGCMGYDTIVVAQQPLHVAASITASTNLTCFGSNDGDAAASGTGGTAPYTYLWNTAPAQTNTTATGLSAGTYSVVVTDSNGCTGNDNVLISEPPQLVLSFSAFPANCGTSDGSAVVAVTGSTGPYTYQWSPGGGANDTLSAIPIGVYSVLVTDADGCSVTGNVIVNNTGGATASLLGTTDVLCNGDSDGTATIAVTGGITPYTYSWNTAPVQTNAMATGLSAGAYNCMVTDAGGCIFIVPLSIDEPQNIVVTISPDMTICPGAPVLISATATGGTQPYVYTWDNGLGNDSTHNVSPTSITIYTVIVVDANLCPGDTQSVTISTGTALSVIAGGTDTICVGEIAVITSAAMGGVAPYTYLWDNGEGNNQIATVSPINSTIYTVTVTDSCGTTATGSVGITIRSDVVLTPPTALICPGDSATITASGALYYWWIDTLTSDTFATVPTITVSPAVTSSYLIVASDATCYKTDTATVFVDNSLIADFSSDPTVSTISDPNFVFTDLTQRNVISWYWDFGDGDGALVQNSSHSYNDTGTYQVTLAVEDSNGCVDTVFMLISVTDSYTLFAPNSFTPNDDGHNDYFFPIGLGMDEASFQMLIFNRWGDLIYETEGVFGDYESTAPVVGWDGRANHGQKVAQEDVYIWLINIADNEKKKHQYVGHVTLIR